MQAFIIILPLSNCENKKEFFKQLQAPLFWIPFDMNGTLTQKFWPVILVECNQSRLLCGIPDLDQLHPSMSEDNQPEKNKSSIKW